MWCQLAGTSQTIHLAPVAPPPAEPWMGHSAGRWEGNTLVVDVSHFNDRTWFSRSGDFHSDALHVVERFTPINPDALRYEVTIDDSNVTSYRNASGFIGVKRSEEHTSELQSHLNIVCRLLLE